MEATPSKPLQLFMMCPTRASSPAFFVLFPNTLGQAGTSQDKHRPHSQLDVYKLSPRRDDCDNAGKPGKQANSTVQPGGEAGSDPIGVYPLKALNQQVLARD